VTSTRFVTARALDGLQLTGTLVLPSSSANQAVVLVHGGGVTRDEGASLPGWQMASVRPVSRRYVLIFVATGRARGSKRIGR
jgi:dipeptidyl aminopeptidase/acylaminoacyl peptidase